MRCSAWRLETDHQLILTDNCENIVLPNLFCFGRFDFGVALRRRSDALHLSFQNECVNWMTVFFIIVFVVFLVCVCSYARSLIIFSSQEKPSYLFLHPAKHTLISIPRLYLIFTTLKVLGGKGGGQILGAQILPMPHGSNPIWIMLW